MNKIYSLLASLAVVGTLLGMAYFKGRSDGRIAEASRHAEAVRELNDTIREYERDAEQRERERLAEVRRLEGEIETLREAADADPDANRSSVPARSVRRIDSVK